MANPISILTTMRLKGALVLDEHNSVFPETPQIGMLVVKDLALYTYALVDGIPSWYPLIRVPERYMHTQVTLSDVWVVNHNLNSPDIWYQAQTPNGQMVVPASVELVNNNIIRLTFNEPTEGSVLIVSSGEHGVQGDTGPGLPAGGSESQVLVKASDADFDFVWAAAPVGGNEPSGDPYAAYDVLRMRFQGADGSRDFVEDIGGYTITYAGGQPPYLSNAQVADGISSLRLTGAGHMAITPQNNQLDFKTGNWTLDALLYTADQSVQYASWLSWADSQFSIEFDDGFHPQAHTMLWNDFGHLPEGVGAIFSPGTYPFGTWQHVRYLKCENTLKLFVEKKLVYQRQLPDGLTTNFARGGAMLLGVLASTGQGYNGYLGYLRLTAAARTRDSFRYDSALVPN